jgi:hypothetical protein
VGISGSITPKSQMNTGTLFNEGLESRDQLNQEVAALLQQYGLPAVTERLNAIGAIPPEPTEQQTTEARKRDMGKDAEPWWRHETIIGAVLTAQFFADDWAREVEDWQLNCSQEDYYRLHVPRIISNALIDSSRHYEKLGQVRCLKSNLEAICLLRAFMASQLRTPGQTITTACILNSICTIGYVSYQLCEEIFDAHPDDLMVGGPKRRAATSMILKCIEVFVEAKVLEPAEKRHPYPRAHATKQKLCDAWRVASSDQDLPF